MPSSVGHSTPTPIQTCPMGTMCKGLMGKPFSGLWLIVPGVVFIVLGLLIVIEPRVLLWVIAASFVLFGLMMLMMVGLPRRMFHAAAYHE